jgi:1-deoxy-D-xylulose-5-phosphate synthase
MTGHTRISLAEFPLLKGISLPADLRAVDKSQLGQVADEVRSYLIQTLSHCGGHFAAGLGTVELTVALHYVYNTPDDKLVWDVGHQAYPHKILTGRREQLHTIRRKGGLSPFPKRSESEYDTFGVGHSSTSIAAALGMALAAQQLGSERRTCAVIGDGAITAGMAFEALNHAGSLRPNMLVVLNDNAMSISENVGALNKYFAKLLSSRSYEMLRNSGKKVLSGTQTGWEFARRSEEFLKGMATPSVLFEELGFNYIGPIDGHDLPLLVETIGNMRDLEGPQFLHIVTKKGKGYAPAEADPIGWHAVSGFNQALGEVAKKPITGKSYTSVFSDWLCDIAKQDHRVVGITPAMREGSGLVEFSQKYPDRYFDVAIAEQHAVTLAAGMACDGLKPIVAIYSTFLQRGYDQLVHDVAIQNLPVVFAIDRAGIVGPDGQTHAGSYDLSFMRCLPNLVIMAPADENECRQMLYTAWSIDGPTAVRYPRGNGPGEAITTEMAALPVGKAEIKRDGKKIAILGFGSMLSVSTPVANALDATLVNMRFVKPLDGQLLTELAASHDLLVTVEDNVVAGGAGSAVNEFLHAAGISATVLNLGLPDECVEHGSREEVLADVGLDSEQIQAAIETRLNLS